MTTPTPTPHIMASVVPKYLVYSREHNLWWRDSRSGYTPVIENAGRYTLNEAKDICGDDGLRGRRGFLPANDEGPSEFYVPAPECIPGTSTPDSAPAPASGEGPYRVMAVRTHAGNYGVVKGRMVVAEFYTALDASIGAKLANDAFAAGAASTATRDSGQGENDHHTNLSSAEQENERLHGRMAEALEACVAARLALTNHNLWCGHNKHAPGHPSCREAKEKLDRVLRDMAFTALGPTQPTPSVGSGEQNESYQRGFADGNHPESTRCLQWTNDTEYLRGRFDGIAAWESKFGRVASQPPPTPDLRAVVVDLVNSIVPLVRIADAYDDNGLDDGARKFWGKNDEHKNETDPDLIELYSGRGGKELLTLAHCLHARAVFTIASTALETKP